MPITQDQLADDVVIVKRAIRTLTDAEIKGLPTTVVELVPAPGAGQIILPVAVFLQGHVTETEYTNFDDPNQGVNYYLNVLFGNGGRDATNYCDATAVLNGYSVTLGPSSTPNTGFTTHPSISLEDVENKALVLTLYNAAGNLTGGDPSNSLKATTLYTVISA